MILETIKKRKCAECKQWSEESNFHKNGYHRGVPRLDSYCKNCKNDKSLKRHKDNNWQYVKNYRSKNLEKGSAQQILRSAVFQGKIFKPDSCSKCGEKKEKRFLGGHHADYAKPLEVIWLCHQCHKKEHCK